MPLDRVADPGGEIVAGRDLRDPDERDGLDAAAAVGGSVSSAASASADIDGLRRPDRRSRRPALRLASARSRSSGVSRSSGERPAEDRRGGRRLARAAGSWAIALSPPKQTSIASGGASSRAFVPRPWRSGTIADERPVAARRARPRRVDRVRRRRRAGRSAG